MCLAKLICHDYEMMQIKNSVLAAAILNMALILTCKVDSDKEDVKRTMQKVLEFG